MQPLQHYPGHEPLSRNPNCHPLAIPQSESDFPLLYFIKLFYNNDYIHTLVPSFHRSIVPSFHRSIVLSFHCSIVPSFYRSIVPSFHRSIVPSFYRSIVPIREIRSNSQNSYNSYISPCNLFTPLKVMKIPE